MCRIGMRIANSLVTHLQLMLDFDLATRDLLVRFMGSYSRVSVDGTDYGTLDSRVPLQYAAAPAQMQRVQRIVWMERCEHTAERS